MTAPDVNLTRYHGCSGNGLGDSSVCVVHEPLGDGPPEVEFHPQDVTTVREVSAARRT